MSGQFYDAKCQLNKPEGLCDALASSTVLKGLETKDKYSGSSQKNKRKSHYIYNHHNLFNYF